MYRSTLASSSLKSSSSNKVCVNWTETQLLAKVGALAAKKGGLDL